MPPKGEDAAASIFKFVKRGSVEDVEKLAKSSSSCLKAVNPKGQTPLHVAAEQGDYDLCAALIRLGAKVDEPETKGHRRTALQCATVIGDTETVDVLLRGGADAGVVDAAGQNALHLATKMGYKELTDAFLALDDMRRRDLKRIEGQGEDATDTHSRIKAVPPIQLVAAQDKEGLNPLMVACGDFADGDAYPGMATSFVKVLRAGDAADADRIIAAKAQNGMNALHMLASSTSSSPKCVDVAKQLLALGCNLQGKDDEGETPVFPAARTNCVPLLKLFLETDETLATGLSASGNSLLHAAAEEGAAQSIKLLAGKVDVTLKNDNGDTAVAVALENLHKEVADALVACGGSKEEVDRFNQQRHEAEEARKEEAAAAATTGDFTGQSKTGVKQPPAALLKKKHAPGEAAKAQKATAGAKFVYVLIAMGVILPAISFFLSMTG